MGLFSFLLLALVGLSIYILTLMVHHLFFRPLSKYPGPLLAATSYAYEFYFDAWQSGKYIWQIEKLHGIYGPIVRVTPNEIHVNDPAFYDEIYASIDRKRNVYDWSRRGIGALLSLGATVEHYTHRVRRNAFNSFWSRASVTALEPMINDKIDRLWHRLKMEPGVVKMSDAFLALTMDIIGQFTFGKDYGYLQRDDLGGKWRRDVTAMMRNAKNLTPFNFLATIINALPEKFVLEHAPPAVANLVRYKKEIRAQVNDVLATSDGGKGIYRTVFHHLRDDLELPAVEKSVDRLQQEGQVLIMAGSETTGKTLSIILFHLLSNPEWLENMRSEVRDVPLVDGRRRWSDLERLPYLTGVIPEGLRLNFGITGRNQRYTIDDTFKLGGYTIGPGVPMSMMSLFMNANAVIFPDPFRLLPDRWLQKGPEVKFDPTKRKFMATFGRGARRYIAINLAHAELYLTLAAVVSRLDLRLLDTDETDVAFMHDFTIIQSRLDSKGVQVQ